MKTVYLCRWCLGFFSDEKGVHRLERVAGKEDDEIEQIECSYCKNAREIEEVREG